MRDNFYVEFEKALSLVLEDVPLMPWERVSIFDSYRRVLAEDVKADRDNPPADVSAMDGYGVRSDDLSSLPVELEIVGEVPAGKLPEVSVGKGQAVKLFTGSIIPEGCDTVVPVEYVEEKEGKVKIKKAFPKGANVRLKGEDYKEGAVILERGEIIKPVEMGILASLNRSFVKVSVKPRVGIITTGSEIVEPGEPLTSVSQIRNSNAYTLFGLVKEAGGDPVYFGVVSDDREKTKEMFLKALEFCDLVVSSGGVSMGNYDFVKEIIPEIGIQPVFYKVKVKPGKPVFFGKKDGKFIFALPGFPVSTAVSFNNFVFPFIRKMLGAKNLFRKKVKGVLVSDFKRRKSDRLEFARCKYVYDENSGEYKLFPLKRQGSGILSAMKGNVGIMVVPIGVDYIPKGSTVDFILCKES